MPNWCSNRATITAVTEEAKQLVKDYDEYLKNEDASKSKFFGWFIPVPEDLTNTTEGYMGGEEGEKLKKKQAENVEKYGFRTWYDFCIENWGTKWDSDLGRNDIDGDTINFSGDTAWGPPTAFYREMEEMGFEVDASYSEEGAGFYGTYSNGCDESLDVPTLTGAAGILQSYYNDYFNEYNVPEIDFASIKAGDTIVTESGETFIYVSHNRVSRKMILEEYPQLDDENLWVLKETMRKIAELDEDVFEVVVNFDQAKPGTETCIVFESERTKMIFSES